MVVNGKAAFQLMGDWAKAEFLVAKKKPNIDFYCAAAPGTQDKYSYLVDSFAMFQLKSWESQKAQGFLAYSLMSPEFQEKFNTQKGSIPVRQSVPLESFDDCAKLSLIDFKKSVSNNSLVPSVAFAQGTPPNIQSQIQSVISSFWENDAMSIDEATTKLAAITLRNK
jgi:glucose/mannose transport system substrate-binding protein